MGRRITVLLASAALALGALGLGLGAPGAGAAQVGINVAATSGNFFRSPKVIDAIRATRPAWVRVFMGWNGLEPGPGDYNTSEIANYQRFFAALPAKTKIDVDVWGSPPWANGGSSSVATPPTDDADYAGFVNYLVNAFHGRVASWEIWNEEDNSGWWSGTPAQYASMLEAAYPAVKSADPDATVLVGGLTGNDGAYLNELYAAGAKGSFDGVGVHTDTACNITSPYVFEYNPGTRTINQYFFLGFMSVHAAMVANGNGELPIYMTELGWSSTSAECEQGHWAGQKLAGVSEQTQATYLEQAYHCLAQPEYSYVKAAMWFELFDEGDSANPIDNYGLLNADLSPKPAYAAFRRESLHGDQLSGPCGDFSPPKIQILRPTSGQRSSGPLRIAVRASDAAAGVREITIDLTRHSREHFHSRHLAKTLTSAMTWLHAKRLPPGRHTIRVIATDKFGNVATTSVSFTHIAPLRSRARRRHRR